MVDTLIVYVWQNTTMPFIRSSDGRRLNTPAFDHAAISIQQGATGTQQVFTVNPVAYAPFVFPAVRTQSIANFTRPLGAPTQSFVLSESRETVPVVGASAALSGLASWFGPGVAVIVGAAPATLPAPAISAYQASDSMTMAFYAVARFVGRNVTGNNFPINNLRTTAGFARSALINLLPGQAAQTFGTSIDGTINLDRVRSSRGVLVPFGATSYGSGSDLVGYLNLQGRTGSSTLNVNQTR